MVRDSWWVAFILHSWNYFYNSISTFRQSLSSDTQISSDFDFDFDNQNQTFFWTKNSLQPHHAHSTLQRQQRHISTDPFDTLNQQRMTLGHAEHRSHLGGPNHPSPTSRSMPPPPPPDVVGVGPEYEANPHIYMEVHDPLTSTSSPPRASTTSPRRHRSGHRQVLKIFKLTSIWSLITTLQIWILVVLIYFIFFHSSLQRGFTRRMTSTFGQHFLIYRIICILSDDRHSCSI